LYGFLGYWRGELEGEMTMRIEVRRRGGRLKEFGLMDCRFPNQDVVVPVVGCLDHAAA
jgi:hypothetical protein